MPLFSIVEGWTGILGPFILRTDGVPLNLTGFTLTLRLRNAAGAVVVPLGVITPDPNQVTNPGKVTYVPAAADFVFGALTLGPVELYKFHWKVVDGASKVVYFPSGAPDEVEVYRA